MNDTCLYVLSLFVCVCVFVLRPRMFQDFGEDNAIDEGIGKPTSRTKLQQQQQQQQQE